MNAPDADRMGAWRDEVAGVLGEHRATPIVDDGILIGYGCPLPCEWGSEGGYDPDAHRDHLAQALLPLLARIDREARVEALREAAEDFGPGQLTGLFANHGGYARAWLRDRADRIEAKP